MPNNISPIVQWAGGKRQLLPIIRTMLPVKYNDYYEPFFGGGAVFCDIDFNKAVINDLNPVLINMYRQCKDNPKELCSNVDLLCSNYNSFFTEEDKRKYYYKIRDEFNFELANGIYTSETAAHTLFLNRTGFNGLYRVNSSGEYNVSFGNKGKLSVYNTTNMFRFSEVLNKKDVTILCGDFEVACADVKTGDFVFFDSPYYETFDNYQQDGFSEEDHIRLFNLFRRLTDLGAYCMLTNNDCDYIKDLYKDFNVIQLDVKRMINCEADNRVGKEVLITNYTEFKKIPHQAVLF